MKNIENTQINETIFSNSRRKRIRRKKNRIMEKEHSLKLLGNNANSLVAKMESLENILVSENPSAIFLQETKLGRAGRIKTKTSSKYTWYELHRTNRAEKGKHGGGLALGVLNVLEPSWISEGDDSIEALTVEIWVEGFPIRLLCGYGPQENDQKDRKKLVFGNI